MPDGSVMRGPEHAEAVEGSERPASQADVDATMTLLQEGATLLSTDTSAFKSWFKESKIVDEAGEPLIVYHGTLASFETFRRPEEIGLAEVDDVLDMGFHFGSREQAEERILGGRIFKGGKKVDTSRFVGQNIVPVYLSVQNPLRLKDEGVWDSDTVSKQLFDLGLMDEENIKALKDAKNRGVDEATNIKSVQTVMSIAGYDGVVYENSVEGTGDSYIAFKPEQIKSTVNIGVFDPQDPNILRQAQQPPKGPRGALSFANNEYLISLFERADLSTLLHETGHLFFAEMESLVKTGTASQAFQKDFNTVTTWLGAEEGKPLTVSQKEKFARGFEAYLREGKAPSADLERAFDRFKKWLTNVYKSLTDLNVEINDEVRAVFDRLLVAEQETTDAATLNDMTLLSKEQMDALGIVSDDREYMARLIKEAKDNAQKVMEKARNDGRKKNMEKWRADAKTEVEALPVYIARDALIKGEGLNKAELVELYGEDILTKLPRNAVKVDGMNIEWAAYAYQFETTDAMLKALTEAPPKQEAIDTVVQARSDMHDAQFQPNDYLSDTKEYAEYLFVKAKYLARGGKAASVMPRQAFKIHADRILAAMPVKDAIRHDIFLSAMRKYSKIEGQKIHNKKMGEAADANEKVRLNYEMAGKAVKNRKEVNRIIKKAKKAAKSKTINPDYRENLLAVIQRFGIGTESMVPQRPDEKTPLVKLLSDVDEAVDQMAFFSDWILNESYQKDYRELTMGEMEELGQLVDFLIGKGRDLHKSYLADGRTLVEDAAATIAEEISKVPKKRVYDRLGVMRKLTSPIRKYFAMMDSFNFVAIALGGYRNIGKKGVKSEAEKLTIDRLIEAQTQKDLTHEKIQERIKPFVMQLMHTIKDLTKKHGKRMVIEGADTPQLLKDEGQANWWSPNQVLAIAMNMGNEGDIQRLYSGYEGLTPASVNKLLDLLSKKDWDAIQGIWDTINSMFKDIDAVNYKLNFFHMTKVEAKPLVTKHGTYKGGYYPIKYDGSLLGKEAQNVSAFTEKEELMARTEAMFQVPAAKSGMTKARADKITLPLKLSLNVITEHIQDTVQYITHAEAVRDVDRILRHKNVVKPIQEALGRDVYNNIRPALKNIARQDRDYSTWMDRLVDKLRGVTTPFILGLNAGVAFKQWFSSPAVMFEIGVKDYINGYAEVMFRGSPTVKLHAMKEMSPYIRQRAQAMDRELQSMFSKMSPDQKVIFFGDKAVSWEDVRNFGFWPIRFVDMATVMPVWYGSFNRALRENNGDIDEAVKAADDVVRRTQPSAQAVDLSQWQYGGGAIRLFSMF
ncbi:MAG: hypothetical protein KAR06_02190, partial [Deltaproteobacteria bacterium]|nr:hypothetical protein [Deltaproteobacteria bacterium]